MTAKLYSLERTIGSRQCKSHRYEVCTVRETDTFSSNVTDARIFEYNCLIYSLKYKSWKKQYLGETANAFWLRYKNFIIGGFFCKSD